MASVSLHIRNLRALRLVTWSLPSVSALVGANGAGKTTLILGLKFLRAAYDRGVIDALAQVLDGAYDLRNRAAPEEEPVELGLDVDSLSWRVRLGAAGTASGVVLEESLHDGASVVFKSGPGGLIYDRMPGLRAPAEALCLRHLMDLADDDERLSRMSAVVQRTTAFHDPDLWKLRTNGSSTKENRHVQSRGSNSLTMLRRWLQERHERPRYSFVVDTLKSAFPRLASDLDFEEAGQTLTARIFSGTDPTRLAFAANGVLSLLVTATEIAGADDGGIVAIDEPENGLHPYAVRRLIARATTWAAAHDLKIVMSTHSTALLDSLSPEQVFVLRPGGERGPCRVDQLRNREWLSQYRLGQVYEDGELGDNSDAPVPDGR